MAVLPSFFTDPSLSDRDFARCYTIHAYKDGQSPVDIAKDLGITPWLARDWLRKAGSPLSKSAGLRAAYARGRRSGAEHSAKLRQYSVNETVFERRLTQETAWALGVIVGDGCVCRRPDGKITALEVVGDRDVCEKVSAIVGSNAPIKHLKGGCYGVRYHSPHLAKSLARWGIGPAKTYTVRLPEVPKRLLPDLVRGYWDADGCVTFKRQYQKINLSLSAVSASPLLIKDLQSVIAAVLGRIPKASRCGTKRTQIVSLACQPARLFGQWLWRTSSPLNRGDRKYQRLLELGGLSGCPT